MNNITRDGLPDRLRALAEDEIAGRVAPLSPGNSHDLLAAADEIDRLRLAIRRLAEQDATLSVCNGNVTVDINATLTDAEREAADRQAKWLYEQAKHKPIQQALAAIAREELLRVVAARRAVALAAVQTGSLLRRLDRSIQKLSSEAT